MSGREQFAREHPGVFFLDRDRVAELSEFAANAGWLLPGECIQTAERAGEGNMNCTLRVKTTNRTFIVKQARPWVEKYPHIPAPWDRAFIEATFYREAQRLAVSTMLPALLGFDAESHTLMLEDLGGARDFTFLYAGDVLGASEIHSLVLCLVDLHSEQVGADLKDVFANREMRRLNHEHIFDIPLRENNGLDLEAITPRLECAAKRLRADAAYCRRVRELGKLYLADGDVLVHGDYFPGSWLQTCAGVKVIDPEFCFLGASEFDLGVMLAHCHLSRQPDSVVEMIPDLYRAVPSAVQSFDIRLAKQFAGVEIMRRLMGVSQLPLSHNIQLKETLLDLSRSLVLN
jgi:5-methylthioribose kinase